MQRLVRTLVRGFSSELSPPFQACKELIAFIGGDVFEADTPLRQIVVATVTRSRDTFSGVCMLAEQGFPFQAPMLARSLFEDLVVAHWIVLNEDDPQWLIDRFFRHRDAMALYQSQLAARTDWRMGPPIVSDASTLKSRQNALRKEFGGEAQKNWWDPGKQGEGCGEPIGLRGIAQRLEEAAARHERFHPRLAGGQEPLLTRAELVVQKWFTQYLHHTAVGLPVQPQPTGELVPSVDPTWLTLFWSYWMYAQQVYLLHDLYRRDMAPFEELFRGGFTSGFGLDGGRP